MISSGGILQPLLKDFFSHDIAPGINLSIFDGQNWQDFSQGLIDDRDILTDQKTYYDIASLTKTIVSTCILDFINNKVLSLSEPVGNTLDFLEKFPGLDLKQLLNHTSGLNIINKYDKTINYSDQEINQILFNLQNLKRDQLTTFCYNDLNYIYLGKFLQYTQNLNLEEIVSCFLVKYNLTEIVFNPLKSGIDPSKIARSSKNLEAGIVHDEKARWLKGVSGHAGLFATLDGLKKFTKMWLNNSFNFNHDLFNQAVKPELNYTPKVFEESWLLPESYGLVWRTGRYSHSLNHAGFTGPQICFDLPNQKALVLTCSHTFNGVNSDQKGKYQRWVGGLNSYIF